MLLLDGHREKQRDQGCRQTIIQAAFHIERLPDSRRHFRIGKDRKAQGSIRWRGIAPISNANPSFSSGKSRCAAPAPSNTVSGRPSASNRVRKWRPSHRVQIDRRRIGEQDHRQGELEYKFRSGRGSWKSSQPKASGPTAAPTRTRNIGKVTEKRPNQAANTANPTTMRRYRTHSRSLTSQLPFGVTYIPDAVRTPRFTMRWDATTRHHAGYQRRVPILDSGNVSPSFLRTSSRTTESLKPFQLIRT